MDHLTPTRPTWIEAPEDAAPLEQALAEARRAGDRAGALAAARQLADLWLARGEFDQAERGYLTWLAEAGEAPDRVELAAVHARLAMLLARTTRLEEAAEHLRRARELEGAAGAAPDPQVRAAGALGEAWLAIQSGREVAALEPAELALSLAESHGWPQTAADARQCLGIACSVAGRLDEALDHLFDSYSYQHARANRVKMLSLLSNLGVVSTRSGHTESARAYLRRAAAIGSTLGSDSRLGLVLLNLGIVNLIGGNLDEAEADLRESIRIQQASGIRRLAIAPTLTLAQVCIARRRFDEAAELVAEAERLTSEGELERHRAEVDLVAGELALARGDFEPARERFDSGLAWLGSANPAAAGPYRGRAEAQLALGRGALAEADAAEALRLARASEDRVEEGVVRRVLSELAARRRDFERALTEIHRSVDLLRSAGYQRELAHSLIRLAGLRIAARESGEGAGLPGAWPATIEDILLTLAEAARIYDHLGDPVGGARCALERARLQGQAGMLDRALASFDRARPVLEAQGLADDRKILRQVAADLREAVERSSTARHDRYAGLARALGPRGGPVGGDPALDEGAFHALFTQVAGAVAADRMFLASLGPAPRIVAAYRVAERRAEQLLRWLLEHGPAAEEGGPRRALLLSRSLVDLPARLFPRTGSLAALPARPVGSGAEYLLYVERRQDHPEGVLAGDQIAFLGAAAEALADLESSSTVVIPEYGEGAGGDDADSDGGSEPAAADRGRRAAAESSSLAAVLIAASPTMRRILEQVERIGDSDLPVLILGETGVGKERIARAIHAAGRRRSGVFVPFLPGGLSHELVESQLFGHTRGAFTGADRDRQGLLRAADGGTFFLDEVGEMPLPVQVSFLRFLESGEYRRIGESKLQRADIRVVSATNRDLKDDAKQGRFRRDLYYRLASVVIEVPPLRERIEDIEPLAEHFLRVHAQAAGKPRLRLSREVMEAFMSYPWPGNVRELASEVRRAVALAGGQREVGLDLLSADLVASAGRRAEEAHVLPLDEELKRVERRRLIQALMDADWNQTRAAGALGIRRTTLIARMKRHGIVR